MLLPVSRDIRERIALVCGGEIVYDTLDDVGKTLFKAPFRLGGQSFHDLVVLFQIAYTTSVFVRIVGIDGRALARDYSLRPVLG